MEKEMVVQSINSFLRDHLWMDMCVYGFNGFHLVIAGGLSLSYPPIMEIHFLDVFHFTINTGWTSNTKEDFIAIVTGAEARDINLKFKIEQGNTIFSLQAENHETKFYIACREIEFKQIE